MTSKITIPKRSLRLPPDVARFSSLVDSGTAILAVDHGLEARATTGRAKVKKEMEAAID
jgi:hypothetical protein